MTAFKAVSVDMFQTLVNVQTRIPFIWSRILGDAYSLDAAKRYAAMLFGLAIPRFSTFSGPTAFRTTKDIFTDCFAQLFATAGLACDPAAAARIFADEHGHAEAYADSAGFLGAVSAAYPVCLTTDADSDMITPHLERLSFDRVFVSEELKSYKREPGGRMFAAVLAHYGCEPRQIIHIGDSYADVYGAGQWGITTCWLNRSGIAWEHEMKPDYTVTSLSEVPAILATASERSAD